MICSKPQLAGSDAWCGVRVQQQDTVNKNYSNGVLLAIFSVTHHASRTTYHFPLRALVAQVIAQANEALDPLGRGGVAPLVALDHLAEHLFAGHKKLTAHLEQIERQRQPFKRH